MYSFIFIVIIYNSAYIAVKYITIQNGEIYNAFLCAFGVIHIFIYYSAG